MTDRRFGVELEFGFPGGCYAAEALLRRHGYTQWRAHRDGTNTEIPSPILKGRAGLKKLKEVITLLKANGAYTTGRDGLHVHHEVADFTPEMKKRLAQSWLNNEGDIRLLVPSTRRRRMWCAPINHHDVNQAGYAYGTKYKSLNMAGRGHRTVEIRLHQGTLDYDQIEAWVLFGQSFIESVKNRKHPIACAGSNEVLLNRIRTPKKAKEQVLRTAHMFPTPGQGMRRGVYRNRWGEFCSPRDLGARFYPAAARA